MRDLDARAFAFQPVGDLGLEVVALGPAQVHAQQHLGPVLALGAAGAGVDGDDGAAVIVLAREQHRGFELIERAGAAFRFRAFSSAATSSPSRPSSNSVSKSRGERPSCLSSGECRTPGACAPASPSGASGLFQKSGAAICCSMVRSCSAFAGTSKIAPHSVRLLAELGVRPFEFFEGHRPQFYQCRRAAVPHVEATPFALC